MAEEDCDVTTDLFLGLDFDCFVFDDVHEFFRFFRSFHQFRLQSDQLLLHD